MTLAILVSATVVAVAVYLGAEIIAKAIASTSEGDDDD